jgi:anti-sigma factor RsiW
MSCSPFDLRDYFLKELPDPQRREVDAHVKTCQGCRLEVERLRLMEGALLTLRDEEIPQRIAFVSDKIFEPSAVRRWWSAFWTTSAGLGWAAAAILAGMALRPARPMTPVTAGMTPAPAPVVQTVADADIQARVDAAVMKAVAQVEARQDARTKQLVAEVESTRRRLLMAAGELDISQRRVTTLRASMYNMPAAQGDLK